MKIIQLKLPDKIGTPYFIICSKILANYWPLKTYFHENRTNENVSCFQSHKLLPVAGKTDKWPWPEQLAPRLPPFFLISTRREFEKKVVRSLARRDHLLPLAQSLNFYFTRQVYQKTDQFFFEEKRFFSSVHKYLTRPTIKIYF